MSSRTKSLLKLAAVVLCLVVGGGLLFSRVRKASRVGEEGAQVRFYDQSEKQLYPVSRDTIPPHKGIGGTKGDGVRAMVAAPKGDADAPAKRRIAYLETYTPELKQLLHDVIAARAARRPYPGKLPSRDGDYFWHQHAGPASQRTGVACGLQR